MILYRWEIPALISISIVNPSYASNSEIYHFSSPVKTTVILCPSGKYLYDLDNFFVRFWYPVQISATYT